MLNVPIFFACDDNYIPFLDVTLKSIQENMSKNNFYDIKILNSGISDNLKTNLINNYVKDNFSIEFVDINPYLKDISSKLHVRDYYSKTTYFRLFIPRLYPQLDKCLYLDCDIIVRDDIANLFAFDIGDNLVGGIPDEIVYKTEEFRQYAQKRLGIIPENYINAGILVMNLKELRNFDFENKFIDLLSKIKFSVAQDQDYINVICKNRIKYLPKIWNKQPLFDKDVLDKNTISLLHFNLNLKPWHYDNIMYEEEFWKYAKLTKYHDNLLNMKSLYSYELKKQDSIDYKNLKELAYYEANVLGEINING